MLPNLIFGLANFWIENDQLAMDAQLAATLDIEEHEENGMMMEW